MKPFSPSSLTGIGLHVLADTLGSVSVITSSILIMVMDWHIADPICSFCISIMIFISVIPLFQECIASLSQRVPDQLQPALESALQHVSFFHLVERMKSNCKRLCIIRYEAWRRLLRYGNFMCGNTAALYLSEPQSFCCTTMLTNKLCVGLWLLSFKSTASISHFR